VESDSLSLSDLLGLVRRRFAVFGLTFVALVSVTVLVAFGLPSVYDSTGTILIEQQNIPDDLVQSTITSYADERIEVISQRVMSTDNIAGLIKRYELYGYGEADPNAVSKVRLMQDAIMIEPVSADVINPRSGRPSEATIAFTVTYRNESPALSLELAQEITNLFLEENRRSRAEQTEETVSFLEAQSVAYQSEIDRLEEEIAMFKSDYQGMLPENVNYHLQAMEREDRRATDIRSEIRIQEERIRFLRAERAMLVDESGGAVDHLAELQEELVRAKSIYAPDHPDILRLQKEIRLLRQNDGETASDRSDTVLAVEQVRQELAMANERYSPDHPDVKRLERTLVMLEAESTNTESAISSIVSPAVRSIDSEMRERQANLVGLRQTQREIESRIATIEEQLKGVPEIERQYRTITRRHDDAVDRHDGVQAKLATARMASRLETEQLGERFTLIDAPRMPGQPASPNRLGILMLGIVLAGALAIAALALAEVTDNSIRSVRDVQELLGIPPLATIPVVETATDRRWRITRNLVYLSVAGLMASGAAIGIHLIGQ
jgi:uncharacterized protein involved in exopolysaccharide biosynthesis